MKVWQPQTSSRNLLTKRSEQFQPSCNRNSTNIWPCFPVLPLPDSTLRIPFAKTGRVLDVLAGVAMLRLEDVGNSWLRSSWLASRRDVLKNGCVWKWLVPLNPMVLLIIIPMKNGYFNGNINPTFSDKPTWLDMAWRLDMPRDCLLVEPASGGQWLSMLHTVDHEPGKNNATLAAEWLWRLDAMGRSAKKIYYIN